MEAQGRLHKSEEDHREHYGADLSTKSGGRDARIVQREVSVDIDERASEVERKEEDADDVDEETDAIEDEDRRLAFLWAGEE